MYRPFLIFCQIALTACMLIYFAAAQETLPSFSINRLNDDRALIQWKNPDTSLRQISIQQSPDSLTGFRTILTMPDARLEQNGTVINRPLAGKMFYRIYLMYPRGKYLFTISKSPSPLPPPKPVQTLPPTIDLPTLTSTKIGRARPTDLPHKELTPKMTPENPTDSSQWAVSIPATTSIKSAPAKEPGETKKPATKPEPDKFIPSTRIYTHRDGYPIIQLPVDWDLSQINIRFYLESGEPLFEIIRPPLHNFRIDKTNFHRSGWYKFEIWQKSVRVESNRLYLPLEF